MNLNETSNYNFIAAEFLNLIREEYMVQFPAFPEAFGKLHLQPEYGLSLPLETDGLILYYEPDLVCKWLKEAPGRLKEYYLHIHLHCLCHHMINGLDKDPGLWNMASDLTVLFLMEQLLPDRYPASSLSDWNVVFSDKKTSWLHTDLVYSVLESSPEFRQTASIHCMDSHCFWYHENKSSANVSSGSGQGSTGISAKHLRHLEQTAELWTIHPEQILKETSSGKGRRQLAAGNSIENVEIKEKESIDYHQFLRRFTIPREEAILDMESFDYIPYYYGLTNYNNMPFLEPLEYREVNRLDELAIAIDTSGSCSGRIVRRFLEETWSILRQRENFFSKMRLHLIQCDSMVHEHRIFTGIEEWEETIPDLKIQGFGNTDFRPVFELLDQLIARKEIRHLRGLLYFTDGDGIFPRSAPSYETAFVFLNQELEKHKIPDWGIRLNLNLPDTF